VCRFAHVAHVLISLCIRSKRDTYGPEGTLAQEALPHVR
jgi:hypothetical protein